MDTDVRPARPVLLHVEDDDATAYLFRLALREVNADVDVFRTCDGQDALSFLTRNGVFEKAPQPDIIVLDLHLPKKHGLDVLTEIRQQSAFRHVPVIMLTSSRLLRDREKALSLGANEYIFKPKDWDGFAEVAELVVRFLRL
jgi:chemotaxis family two-component system response regulator Rcp1